MRKLILKFLCAFCAAVICISCIPYFEPANADEPVGKMSSVYGYVLNDCIEAYGVMSTNRDGVTTDSWGEYENPGGVIYADIVNFDHNECPYLVVFSANGGQRTVFCNIWHYSDELERAVKIATLTKNRDDFTDNITGEFNLAWNENSRYITFRTYEDNKPVREEVYTVIDGETFMYVNNPEAFTRAGIIDFGAEYIHPDIDVSEYNETLDKFFSKLKDSAADSVTYENIAPRLTDTDRNGILKTLISAAIYTDLDIARCKTNDEYRSALSKTTSSARFTQLCSLYDLGDGIYYAMFDTNVTKYNYAILRKTDIDENGYQILKARMDGIPLADRELKQMRLKYLQCKLTHKKAKQDIKLKLFESETPATNVPSTPITVKVGDNEAVTVPVEEKKTEQNPDKLIKPIFSFEKIFDDRIKFPAACIGGGISAALLTILWVYICSDNDDEE